MVFSDKMRLSCDWCWLYVLIISRTRFRVNLHSSCLNDKQLLAWNRCEIWSLSDCNWTQTHNHLVHKRTLNYLAKLAKCLYIQLRIPYLSKCCFLATSNLIQTSIQSHNQSMILKALPQCHCYFLVHFFLRLYFWCLRSYELKMNTLLKIKLKSNSVLFNGAISLDNKT